MTNQGTGRDTIVEWLQNNEAAMIALLEELVSIDSGSRDKPGIDAVGNVLIRFYAEHAMPVTRTPAEVNGDILAFRNPAAIGGNKPFLLMGHRDTVFTKGEVARRPFRITDGRGYGPGVADMKAGLVMNAFVAAALQRFRPDIPVMALATGDEEIGSPFSRPHIEEAARGARVVFNSEPGRVTGNIVNGRKGGLTFKLDVEGRAAHSGVNYSEGRSAIDVLARKIIALHALSRVDDGLTINVGVITGGTTVNTVAPQASAEVDLRYVTPEQRAAVLADIAAIVAHTEMPDTKAEFTIRSEFLPLVETSESAVITRAYLQTARSFGSEIAAEFTGGCADSGFTASVGTPTICGAGPVGGKAHTVDEYIEVNTLLERATFAAATILSLHDQA